MMLFQMATGFYISRSLYVAAKLGVADLLAQGPRAATDLAGATHTNAVALRRVLRLLASVGVFAEHEDGSFGLTSLSEALRRGVPGSVRSAVMLFSGLAQDSWSDLMYCVETGEPGFRRHGDNDAFDQMKRNPEAAANFDAAMADFTKMVAFAVAGAYDFSSFRTLVDVGGGNGALLTGLLKANPHLQGIVFDRPDVAERATANLAEAGLADRCRAVGGDFFKEVPGGGDAYLLKHVIHDWNDRDAVAILTTCRRAMPPHASLLLVEGVYPEHIDESLPSRGAASNDVNMLVCTGGRQRNAAEFDQLFNAAGFRLNRIIPTPAASCVIEGMRA